MRKRVRPAPRCRHTFPQNGVSPNTCHWIAAADVFASLDDVAFARFIAKGVAEGVADARAGGNQIGIAGVAHLSDEADQVVFVDLHVPRGPTLRGLIGPQVTVDLLTLGQFGCRIIHFCAQNRITTVDPFQRGRMQPFARMLAIPGLTARTMAKAIEHSIQIHLLQPVRGAGGGAQANPSALAYPVGPLEILPVRDGSG